MLTVVDRPVIQHVVDEAREGGHRAFRLRHRPQQAGHRGSFRQGLRARHTLAARNKTAQLEELKRDLPAAGATSSPASRSRSASATPSGAPRDIVGDEPFALLLPDMLHLAKSGSKGCIAAMIEAYNATGGNYVAGYEGAGQRGAPVRHHRQGQGRRPPAPTRSPPWSRSRRRAPRPPTSRFPAATSSSPRSSRSSRRRSAAPAARFQLTDGMLKLKDRQPFFGFTFDVRDPRHRHEARFLTANLAYALRRARPRGSAEGGDRPPHM